VDSTGKMDMMRAIGFDHVIDYKKEDFTKNGKTYDLILDAKTNRSPFDYCRVLDVNGVYATVGGSSARLIQILLLAPWIRRSRKNHIRVVILKPNKDLPYVNELFDAGKFKPVIDGPYQLDQIQNAFRHFQKGEHKGKVVITL
jgi:NADPH:quinone reductase-like Zn-dependent oxidoreductase